MNIEDIKQDYILGLDEAGTGAWFGPFYIGACLAKKDFFLKSLNDSKKLSEAKRYQIFDDFINHDIKIETLAVNNDIIDNIGLGKALKQGYEDIIKRFNLDNVFIILDGSLKINNIDLIIPKADGKYQQVMAASIAAKVSRDRYILGISGNYRNYNLSKNKGYGTKDHIEAIQKHGITELHRKSYKPIKEIIDKLNSN